MKLYFWWVNFTHGIIRKIYGLSEKLNEVSKSSGTNVTKRIKSDQEF